MQKFKNIKEFIAWLRRQLGEPMVKVELTDEQIRDNIYSALDMFIKYASGNASEDVYYVLNLKNGISDYTLPEGVLDILEFDDSSNSHGGINTLFTLENSLYSAGLLDFNSLTSNSTLITYHLAMDFLEVIDRYKSSNYKWTYDNDDRLLHIYPAPKADNVIYVNNTETGIEEVSDTAGWALLHLRQLHGAGRDNFSLNKAYAKLLSRQWVKEYTLALCKITLGIIRRKFDNYASIGNTGINLDGDALLSEGKEEKERLEEDLSEKENYEGYGIITGIV